jgi:hypothetical protein
MESNALKFRSSSKLVPTITFCFDGHAKISFFQKDLCGGHRMIRLMIDDVGRYAGIPSPDPTRIDNLID